MEDNLQSIRMLGVQLPVGQHRKRCPSCSKTRRNKSDQSMSLHVYNDRVVYQCHHCEIKGVVPFEERQRITHIKKTPVVELPENRGISQDAVMWLMSRGISEGTAKKAGIYSLSHFINSENKMVNCIAFPYIFEGTPIGAKIRSIGTKGFSCINALHHFYNHDSINEKDPIILCEGEIDCLSFLEAGFKSAVSIPNGATVKNTHGAIDPDQDTGFDFLWECEKKFADASKIVIAMDTDAPGQSMAEELARRIGKEKCYKVDWPDDCKDANDCLIKYGQQGLVDMIDHADPWPIIGVYSADHFVDEIKDLYKNGTGKGYSVGYSELNQYYTMAPGQVTVVTGIPSSGKSEFVDSMMMNLAHSDNLTFAVCSFENEPKYHILKLLAKWAKKPFFKSYHNCLNEKEFDEGMKFVNKHFTFLHQSDGSLSTIESIIERLRSAVLRTGIRGAVIDPYNYIAKSANASETEWISDMLTRLRVFAMSSGIHIWFVAHPTKLQRIDGGKLPVPKGYDISGSAAWFSKTDCGLTVHRPNPSNGISEIHVWKCRFNWVGKQGYIKLIYDVSKSEYSDMSSVSFSPSVSYRPPPPPPF